MKITHKKQKRTVFSVGRTSLLRFVLILSLAIPFNLFAQKAVINGVVSDSKNESIIGANVLIKGTTTGTITDFDGKFSIEASKGDILVISYIGMNPKEVKIGSERNLKIVLEEDMALPQAVRSDMQIFVARLRSEGVNPGLPLLKNVSLEDILLLLEERYCR